MRGVIAVCVIYMLLPITLMYLLSLFSSGFPVFPLLTGLAIWWSNRKDQRR
jgi:ABC-type spermidine/putrescine transport system permease subunit II